MAPQATRQRHDAAALQLRPRAPLPPPPPPPLPPLAAAAVATVLPATHLLLWLCAERSRVLVPARNSQLHAWPVRSN